MTRREQSQVSARLSDKTYKNFSMIVHRLKRTQQGVLEDFVNSYIEENAHVLRDSYRPTQQLINRQIEVGAY